VATTSGTSSAMKPTCVSGLAPMDIVGVLTKVVQEQQKTISELRARLERLEKK
jgi:hypothetical protein